jgi:hypothetical protein
LFFERCGGNFLLDEEISQSNNHIRKNGKIFPHPLCDALCIDQRSACVVPVQSDSLQVDLDYNRDGWGAVGSDGIQ